MPGLLTEPLPFGDVPEDSLPITSWISKTFSASEGMTFQEARGIMVPRWRFQAFQVSVFSFLKLS